MIQLDCEGRTDLHYAACDGDIASVCRLVASGADVNLQDKRGWAPLHFAAQARSAEVVVYLLNHGAAVDIQDMHGNTPLSTATFNCRGDGTLIRILRGAGADPKKENKHGVSPMKLARTVANFDLSQFYADVIDPA